MSDFKPGIHTERIGRVDNIPASYLGGPGIESRQVFRCFSQFPRRVPE
jgi:hypothetical protein